MVAIDTNLVVRYLTGDHPTQSAQARALIDGQAVFVGLTVLLETEWVLRSVYAYPTQQLTRALRAFAGLPSVTVDDAPLVAQALTWMDGGMDFAEALHLSNAAACDGFATFDRRFIRAAEKLGISVVRTP